MTNLLKSHFTILAVLAALFFLNSQSSYAQGHSGGADNGYRFEIVTENDIADEEIFLTKFLQGHINYLEYDYIANSNPYDPTSKKLVDLLFNKKSSVTIRSNKQITAIQHAISSNRGLSLSSTDSCYNADGNPVIASYRSEEDAFKVCLSLTKLIANGVRDNEAYSYLVPIMSHEMVHRINNDRKYDSIAEEVQKKLEKINTTPKQIISYILSSSHHMSSLISSIDKIKQKQSQQPSSEFCPGYYPLSIALKDLAKYFQEFLYDAKFTPYNPIDTNWLYRVSLNLDFAHYFLCSQDDFISNNNPLDIINEKRVQHITDGIKHSLNRTSRRLFSRNELSLVYSPNLKPGEYDEQGELKEDGVFLNTFSPFNTKELHYIPSNQKDYFIWIDLIKDNLLRMQSTSLKLLGRKKKIVFADANFGWDAFIFINLQGSFTEDEVAHCKLALDTQIIGKDSRGKETGVIVKVLNDNQSLPKDQLETCSLFTHKMTSLASYGIVFSLNRDENTTQ